MTSTGKTLVTALGMVMLLGTARPAFAQTPASGDAALRQEVEAMHRSIDQLVALFKQFMDDAARRDRSALIIRRIDQAERQVATGEQQHKALRDEMAGYEKALAGARGLMESTRSMQAYDKDNKAAEIFNAELTRAQTEETKAQMGVDTTSQKITALEADLTQKRAMVRDLEQQLVRESQIR
jgi:hypothetical protein